MNLVAPLQTDHLPSAPLLSAPLSSGSFQGGGRREVSHGYLSWVTYSPSGRFWGFCLFFRVF